MILKQSNLLESTREEFVLEASSIGIPASGEGAAMILHESMQDYLNLQMAAYQIDLTEAMYIDNEEVMQNLYEAELPGFIKSIMAAAQKFWAHLLEYVKTAYDMFMQAVISDKKFVEDYGKRAQEVANPGGALKGSKYHEWAISSFGIAATEDTAEKSLPVKGFKEFEGAAITVEKAKALVEKAGDVKATEAVLKEFGVKTVAELKQHFMKELSGGEPKDAEKLNSNQIVTMVRAIADAKKELDTLKTTQNDIKKAYNDTMKAIKGLQTAYEKAEKDKALRASIAAAINVAKDAEHALNTVRTSYVGALVAATKARRAEYKHLITAVVTNARRGHGKQEDVNESLNISDFIWGE